MENLLKPVILNMHIMFSHKVPLKKKTLCFINSCTSVDHCYTFCHCQTLNMYKFDNCHNLLKVTLKILKI